MSSYSPPGPASGPGRRIEEAMERIEAELRQAIKYVNDAVVPEMRRESISAMRTLSETLRKLADRIETHSSPPKDPPQNEPSPKAPSEDTHS